jgi:hypothetical protein
MGSRSLTALAAMAALFLAGCPPDADACFRDGTSRQYAGSASYVASVQPDGADGGFFGSAQAVVTVDDFAPESADLRGWNSCNDDGRKTFAIHVGSCTLNATYQSISYDSGRYSSGKFIVATSAIEPGVTCDLPVTGGTATVIVRDGTLTTKPDAVELTFGGDVANWLGKVPTSGHLDFRFDGNVTDHP